MRIKIKISFFIFFSFFSVNSQQFDKTKGDLDLLNKNIEVYTTAKETDLRLTRTENKNFKKRIQPLETEISIFVNPKKSFQTFLGIGGAITDASAEVFSKLTKNTQDKLLNAYFGAQGINYLSLIHI